MNLDAGFPQVAQVLLWPAPVRVALAFLRALWMRGSMRMQAWQRWRLPHYRSLRVPPGLSMEELALQLVRHMRPFRRGVLHRFP
ncbi:hypothetical protein [Diaphorobacter nitroreducens]|uniref:hypothetical protein n=1 Tax=Diaphorobacter nitroreducens TaxID=164759 RepID=UPI00289C1D0F|nr:hypothetical protein [Diaphorobacter nitroreducens]